MRPHTYSSSWTDSAVRRFVRDMGNHLSEVVSNVRADITSANPMKVKEFLGLVDDMESRIATLEEKTKSSEIKPLLDGNELMSLFGKGPGRWIREVHTKLLEKQLENVDMTKEEAIVFVQAELDAADAGEMGG